LRHIYVLTENQTFRLVSANTWLGNVCFEYVSEDARHQPSISYAIFEKDSKAVEYGLDQSDLEDRCNDADIDLTRAAEKGAQDK